jgi:hypothetical protein
MYIADNISLRYLSFGCETKICVALSDLNLGLYYTIIFVFY